MKKLSLVSLFLLAFAFASTSALFAAETAKDAKPAAKQETKTAPAAASQQATPKTEAKK